jgi:DNA polymerase-3 subunit delta
MNYNEILSQLKKGDFKPIYLLHGDEPYYIDLVSDYIEEHCLSEDEKAFNQTIVYGKDANALSIVETAKQFPVMADRQVIIVKEAQSLKDIEQLEAYLENPVSSSIIVLCHKYKTADKRKKWVKNIDKKGLILESKKLYDNKLPDWINAYCNQKNIKIQAKANALLIEFLGNDLSKIANEIDKLLINLGQSNEITPDHIEKYIGISKEYNVFELLKALGQKNIEKVFTIADYFDKNEKSNPLVVTISNLFSFFSKTLKYHSLTNKSAASAAKELGINPYFIDDYSKAAKSFPIMSCIHAIGYLHEYDLKSKGLNNTSASQGELLKELLLMVLK